MLSSQEKRVLAILNDAYHPSTLQSIKSKCVYTRSFTKGQIVSILKKLIDSGHIQTYALCKSVFPRCNGGMKLQKYVSQVNLEKITPTLKKRCTYYSHRGPLHWGFNIVYISKTRTNLMPSWAVKCNNNMRIFHIIIQLKLYAIRFRKRYWSPMGKGGKQTIAHLEELQSPQKICAIRVVHDILQEAVMRVVKREK